MQLFQLFSASKILSGVAMDLMVSVIVFWFFMFTEARKLQMKNPWLYLLATLLVGLSFALPLFLYFRERKAGNRNDVLTWEASYAIALELRRQHPDANIEDVTLQQIYDWT